MNMLSQVVNVINSSDIEVNGDSIFLSNHTVGNLDCLQKLDTQQCVNSFYENGTIVICSDLKIGSIINIELSLFHLSKIGYFENFKVFVDNNLYQLPNEPYYIRSLNCFNNNDNGALKSYLEVVKLIDAIKANAKHNYSEVGIDFTLIFREDKALLLPICYNETNILQLSQTNVREIETISSIFNELDSDKRFLFLNELIAFLSPIEEHERFPYLLSKIQVFLSNANDAYQYYIRNFSYNKLKAELDDAALDYSKKIQAVINESQTKLIAIPTAFVLAVASMDFNVIYTGKNIGLICALFVFSTLIEMFIRNQKSALTFIENSITTYKNSFISNSLIIQNAFSIVDIELSKQKTRLLIIRGITWGLPIALTIIAVTLFICQNPEIIQNIKQWFSQTFQK
ncbi:hypothetical protein D0T51_05530 [Parabacteroides sp. 52]|uniref:hypothetical protein n=1 Tax=unclassified Parabacteroides TaxID=2649774 RepID=UPI0013D1C37E|nr:MULTISPECIES: hypothetical protein [unclassified Parabacteroides]MDH6534576.1 hypothetical protein [Parabacteroides sp. PM5-20]NDV55190.1 hypothetical protein [Parabacteroides sp. 52]